MIAVLRRQHVRKRGSHAPPFRFEGERMGGKPRSLVNRLSRIARAPLLDGQKPLRGKPARQTGKEAARSQAPEKNPDKGARASRAVFARPWLTAVLVCVLLVLFFAPAIAMRGGSQPRTMLPVSSDAEQALYRIAVPEEEQSKPTVKASPSLLKSLKVASYTIRRGETISQIAQKLGLSLDTLISFNGIKDANALSAGTVLEFPNSNGLKYRVRRGDTLERISASFSVPLESILDWNRLTTSVITVGQEVFIPGARMSPAEINKVLGNLFIFPVSGRISSRFGDRNDPFTGVERFHNGIDIVNKLDTPIEAAMAGRVETVGFNSVYGRFIIIKHVGTGYQTMYAHLDKALVTRGENVRQGQVIAELGNTGMSTGAHLHFSIFKNNEPVDPLKFLK